MPRRKTHLGRHSCPWQARRRAIANLTEEEREAEKERQRQRQAQRLAKETPEQRAARLERARLRAQQLRSAATKKGRARQNERDRLRRTERRQQEKARLCAQQLGPPLQWVVKEEDNGSGTVLSENEWRLFLHPSFSGKEEREIENEDARVKMLSIDTGERKGAGKRDQTEKNMFCHSILSQLDEEKPQICVKCEKIYCMNVHESI
nr:PREDICTED: uncharacterized protein LOC100557222 [Anolis carolinensis]|eukprot:XP_003218131.1 PREDICTED: uncharacterized protein LOC100557222 [Anolis carolinensis]